ncbi:MAG TPA: hypothetical protein VGF22_03295 [Acidimicrobiales bacterium]
MTSKFVRVLAVVGVAGAAAAAGTIGLAAAQTGTTTPPTTVAPSNGAPSNNSTPAPPKAGPRRGPGGPFGGFAGPGGNVVHGEFVVPKDNGFETLDVQTGKVTAVSSSSITVVSDDNFSKTYAVTADTLVNSARDGIASIASGNTVRVTATVSGSTATAVNIIDVTTIQNERPKFAPNRPARPGNGTTTTTVS